MTSVEATRDRTIRPGRREGSGMPAELLPGRVKGRAAAKAACGLLALAALAAPCGCTGDVWLPPLVVQARHADGAESTWLTPLFHKTRDPDGSLRDMHFLNLFQGPDYKVFFPLAYSAGPQGKKHRGIVPLFLQGPDYEVIPPLLLWIRRRGDATITVVGGPLWVSCRPGPGTPMRFSVLGGLVARDCDFERGTYRYRILWMLPLGRPRSFALAPVAEE